MAVDFAHNLKPEHGMSPKDAVITACRVRLGPIPMTSLAAIIGGLTLPAVPTIFMVPAAYLLVYGKRQPQTVADLPTESA